MQYYYEYYQFLDKRFRIDILYSTIKIYKDLPKMVFSLMQCTYKKMPWSVSLCRDLRENFYMSYDISLFNLIFHIPQIEEKRLVLIP